MEEGIGH